MTKFTLRSLFLASMLCSATSSADFLITQIGTSGGNPGGQPVYEVSGLVEGDAFNLEWGGVDGLQATGMLFIDDLTSTTADIRVMIDNDNTIISGDDPRITAFGMGVDNLTSLSVSSVAGIYLTDFDTSNFPGFDIDVCGTSGNNCAGGGNGGIPAQEEDTIIFKVTGDFGVIPSLTLDEFAIKVQGGPASSDGDSYELAGLPAPKDGTPDPPQVPVPATGLLFMLGLWMIRTRVIGKPQQTG